MNLRFLDQAIHGIRRYLGAGPYTGQGPKPDPDQGVYRGPTGVAYPDPAVDGISRFTLKNRSAVKRLVEDYRHVMSQRAAEAKSAAEAAEKMHAEALTAATEATQAAVRRTERIVEQLRQLLPPAITNSDLSADEVIGKLRLLMYQQDVDLRTCREALQETRAELARTQDTQQADRRRRALDWARKQFGPDTATDGPDIGDRVVRLAAQFEQYLELGTGDGTVDLTVFPA